MSKYNQPFTHPHIQCDLPFNTWEVHRVNTICPIHILSIFINTCGSLASL